MQTEREQQYNGDRERQKSMTCRKWVKVGNSHRHVCWKAKDHPGPCECSCWYEFMVRPK